MIIQCPACSTKLKLGEATAQKSVIACPKCAQKIRVRPDDAAATVEKKPRKTRTATKKPAAKRPAAPERNRRRSEERPATRPKSQSRKAASRPRSDSYDDEFEDDFDEAPAPRRKPARKKAKSGGGGGLMIGLIGAGVAIALMGIAGGIWWWLNQDNGAYPDEGQAIAQTDSGGGTTSPSESTPSTQPGTPSQGVPFTPRQQPPVEKGEVLQYGWKAGDTHVYNYELKAEIEGKSLQYPGSVSFTVRDGNKPGAQQSMSGTGTGFVITPDGYMLTCHHVTDGATSIDVNLGGKNYAGRVIAFNRQQDIAIVKIDAQNLPTVPLANSDSVQLAEDVRAVGFPLTNSLGSDIKVTRGTISGIGLEDGQKRFTIDANINPGNSGGPLFNGRGQVIGINSAKLLGGATVDSMGFSVPVNQAITMLRKNSVRFTAGNNATVLSGPQLMNQVQPAIALLTIEKSRRSNQQYVLSYSGSYRSPSSSSSSRVTRGGMMRGGPMGFTSNHTSSRGKVVLDAFGEVDDYEDTNQLPFTTGSMALLMIHQLDPDGDKSWSHESKFQLTKPKQQNNSPFGIGGPRFRGGPFGQPQQRQPDEVLMDGVEVYRYRIVSSNDTEVKIAKDYELRTLDHSTKPFTLITGKGTITFDKKLSLPRSMEYQQTFEKNSENVSMKIPMSITYRMQDPSILKKQRADLAAKAAQAKADKDAQAAKEAAMDPKELLDFFVAEIEAKRGKAIYAKLVKLDVVESRRTQVTKLLLPGLQERRPDGNLLAALGKWGTPKAATAMIAKLESLGDNDWPNGKSMILAVANTGEERAIEPIAKRFTARAHPWHDAAKSGLMKFGSKAEDAVLAIVEGQSKPNTKAVELLGEIGTKKSITVLKELSTNKDHWVNKAAKAALGKVAVRIASE